MGDQPRRLRPVAVPLPGHRAGTDSGADFLDCRSARLFDRPLRAFLVAAQCELAYGATVLASDTGPVREIVQHGKNGLLTNFFDIEAMTQAAELVLRAPEKFRPLGEAGRAMINERYSMEVCLPQMLALYDEAIRKGPRTWEPND